MNVLPTITQEVSEPLTWAEICERHPSEWVCLVEIDRADPNSFSFRTARIVGHGKTRGEPLRQARPWRQQYPCVGHYYTGPMVAPPPRFHR